MPSRKFVNDPQSPSRRRALALAQADEELHAKLLLARSEMHLSQTQVAKIMGVSQPTVASFERYDNDPRLSTIRRYAHAVGVSISHSVFLDGVEIESGWTRVGEGEISFSVSSERRTTRPMEAPTSFVLAA
jgi:transcriptional regulator with XRE-family HTH domain